MTPLNFATVAAYDATAPEQLDTTRVTERVRVKLRHSRPRADGPRNLPDAVPFIRPVTVCAPFALKRETKSGARPAAPARSLAM